MATMRQWRMVLRGFVASVATLALLSLPPAVAAESSGMGGGSSKSGGSAKSSSKSSSKSGSKSSSKGGLASSKSKSGASKSGTRSSKGASSKGSPQSATIPASGSPLPSAPVHEDGSPADDVRIRGAYFTEATFAALPCEPVEISVGERRCWRCGGAWFEKLLYDAQPVYVEVFAPEGARIDRLPERAQTIRGESATYYAADDAIYTRSPSGSDGYVVVSTSPGFRVEEIPDDARRGIPIVAGGATYYRYLGVYYREVHEAGRTYYIASESPF
jgi:hypothetical protein